MATTAELTKQAKKQAKKARKQVQGLDFDLHSLKQYLPKDFDFDTNLLHLQRKREDDAASRGFVSGFLLGTLVGVVLALIFAPRRGEETREFVAHTAVDLKDKATDLVSQARGDHDAAADAGKGAVSDIAEDAETVASDVADEVETRTNSATV